MVRRLRRLPPPPSENTLLVKDDAQEGGLNWKNVGDVINNAKTAGQIINANNADKATTSTNVENIVNDNAADSPVIAFTIGDKSFNKTVNNVENAKAINRSIESNEEITLLHAEGSTDGFNLKWASGEDAGTLTIETTDGADSQIRFLQNNVQVLQAINGKCSINGIEFIYNTNGVLQDKNNKINPFFNLKCPIINRKPQIHFRIPVLIRSGSVNRQLPDVPVQSRIHTPSRYLTTRTSAGIHADRHRQTDTG